MPYDSHPAVGVGETQVASRPRTTLWYEIVVVAVFSVVLVAMAPTLLNAIPNDMLRMLAKGPFYVVFVAVPFLIQRILHMPRIDLGFDKEDIPRQVLNGVGIFVAIAVVITSVSFALGDNKHMLLGQGGGIDFFPRIPPCRIRWIR